MPHQCQAAGERPASRAASAATGATPLASTAPPLPTYAVGICRR